MARHRDLIWHVCSDYSLSAAWTTEDAFQEVMCVLWRDLDTFQGKSSERTWVYRVATTTMLMIKRKQSNRPQDAVLEPPRDEATTSPENYNHLIELVGTLEEQDQQIVMAHLDGFKLREIVQMTGLSLPTVARHLSAAKKWLRTQYNK